jgi:hypothetical protein
LLGEFAFSGPFGRSQDKEPDSAAGHAIKSPAREKMSYCEAGHVFLFDQNKLLFCLLSVACHGAVPFSSRYLVRKPTIIYDSIPFIKEICHSH